MTDPSRPESRSYEVLPATIELTKRIQSAFFAGTDVLPEPRPVTVGGRVRWWIEGVVNWTILLLAVVNFALVFFDFSYLEARPYYMRHAPVVVSVYDPVKGIEPHRTTENYLHKAHRTFEALAVAPNAPATAVALKEMREASIALNAENPFADAGLTGVFVQTKNRMRKHMHADSAKAAFTQFWTARNLTPERVFMERRFFEAEIKPLIARNYYRAIGENGRPFDAFWKIDFLFLPIFLLEFLVRGLLGVRRGLYRDWGMFCASRWYDLVYFAPLIAYALPPMVLGPLHLVRFISVAFRMQRLGLINPLSLVQPHTDRAVDLVTDLVNVKLLTNYQDSIRKLDLQKGLDEMSPAQRDALAEAIDRSITVVVAQVLPKVAPDIEALIARSVYQALDASPAFQSLKRVPILGGLHERVIPMVVAEVLAGTQAGLLKAVNDPESRRLTENAINKVSRTLVEQLARTGTEAELKQMVVQMLEDQKRKIVSGA
jgi:hypothetical protein